MTINWNDGTYTFNHGNKIITKSTLQNNKICDNFIAMVEGICTIIPVYSHSHINLVVVSLYA